MRAMSELRYATAAMALLVIGVPSRSSAEVTGVTITSRSAVADGRSFGATGAYEMLIGRIEFALDPSDAANRQIVDLEYAPRGTDGRVRFSSDLRVLRPVDASRGNGVLLFEMVNRGNPFLLTIFNRAPFALNSTALEVGDGLLMRDGYTIVWIGWQFDLPPASALRVLAPPTALPAGAPPSQLNIDVIVNSRIAETNISDDPSRPGVTYAPAEAESAHNVLTVRDSYWAAPATIPREQWRFVRGANGLPRLQLDGGFDPGRWYRISYRPSGAAVAGVGLAAIRDAASAFRYRTDLPISGRALYAFGQSQTGRLLRQFLYDGFNADERGRRVFDAMLIHIAGAARGSFNERFATPSLGAAFTPTLFPFGDAEQIDFDGTRGGLLSRYRREQLPKIFYTNTPVEYWGYGRAAALIHTSPDGTRDLRLPDNVRVYFLAGTQHLEFPFPPTRGPSAANVPSFMRSDGQQLSNPLPQSNIMRALLRALHAWSRDGTRPPDSRYPRLADGTLVRAADVRFPAIAGVGDPRTVTGPARTIAGRHTPLPFLVPQVDEGGNEIAGVRDPEVAVPLATYTGWNFRHERVGNPRDLYPLLGSYIPFAKTRRERAASGDPRPSIEERYRGVDDYVRRVREAADALVRARLMLAEDVEGAVSRATTHWQFAIAQEAPPRVPATGR